MRIPSGKSECRRSMRTMASSSINNTSSFVVSLIAGPFGAVGAATPGLIGSTCIERSCYVLPGAMAGEWHITHLLQSGLMSWIAWGCSHLTRIIITVSILLSLLIPLNTGEHGTPYGIYSPETLDQTLEDTGSLIQRDRSHPSGKSELTCHKL